MNLNSIDTNLIKWYLEENNLSVTQFCKICKITPTTYKKIMANENLDFIALYKIARVIKINVYQMF